METLVMFCSGKVSTASNAALIVICQPNLGTILSKMGLLHLQLETQYSLLSLTQDSKNLLQVWFKKILIKPILTSKFSNCIHCLYPPEITIDNFF